jgi:hypothetical protein
MAKLVMTVMTVALPVVLLIVVILLLLLIVAKGEMVAYTGHLVVWQQG